MTQDPRDLLPHPLALLAHELRTPLNAVIGYADGMRLQTFGPLAAPYDEQAAVIHTAALHLLRLVDEMGEIGGAGAPDAGEAALWRGCLERFDLERLTTDILAMLVGRAAASAIAIRAEFESDPRDIVADRRAIGQILINLLDNALKFTAAGGSILLTVNRDGPDWRVVVADSGGASDPPRGRGLGLRLARALCAAHGGSLALERVPDGGMTATVRLPAPADLKTEP
jgi:two-component system cell cycle sensor histidine kinase PleC